MKADDIRLFKSIGEMQNAIAASSTLEEAIRTGMKKLLENSMADYAVIWYAVGDGKERVLKPYYWICPSDLSSLSYPIGKGIPGRVYRGERRELLADFDAEADEETKEDFAGIPLQSLVCIPFASETESLGCIEFLKTKERGVISEEEADVFEMLAMIAQLAIKAYEPLPTDVADKPVLLSVRNIIKSFRNGEETLRVLKGVNFDVFEGEFLCLLGESGSGKSTVLNILGGLLDADEGSIKFQGKELIGLQQEELTAFRRENIGFVFQSYNLMPNLSVKDNLNLIAELVDSPADTIETLALVGMDRKANNYPSQLSGGQQQRVSIARALIKRPRLILADEPTAALDYETSIGVLSVLENVKKNGTTLVMVTHNEEIARMADRIIRFKNGRSYETTVNARPAKATELEW